VAAGDTYVWEEKEIEKLDFQPFNCTQKKFVICIDTMGQDCEIEDAARRQVLETVQIFKEQWERAEVQCLTQDRDRRIELMSRDPQVEADLQEKVAEVINKAVEDVLNVEQPEQPEGKVVDEEQKQLELSNLRLTTQSEMFKPKDGLLYESIAEIAHLHVVKMPRIVQSAMFLMQIDHDSICEPHSNRLFWKTAKTRIDELCSKIASYKMLGKKETDFRGFQTINYCEKLVNDYQ